MVLPTDKNSSDTDKDSRSNTTSIFAERRQHERRKQGNDRRNSNSGIQHQQAPPESEKRGDDRRNTNGSLNQQLVSSTAHNLAHIWIITEDSDLFNQLQSDIKVSFSSSNISQRTPNQIENQNNKELCNKTVNTPPDIILIDGRSPTERLISLLNQIRKKMASTEIILLYDQISSAFINPIIEYRINGVIQTGTNPELLIKAINTVCTGEIWLPHSLITNAFKVCFKQKEIFNSSSQPLITASEERILKLLTSGLSNKQIAQKLAVSPETIKKHLKSLFTKIGVHTRCELLAWYLSKLENNRCS